ITVNNKRIHTIRVFDATGREMYRSVVNNPLLKIDMSNYAQGMYIVEFVEHDGPGCTVKIQKR
ncbi:MAG TPA: T9SS type A sorting domain-containing protein, partial [Chitinophagaceae bacterium]|nr:T9SS type A sorting domain-containing protein [Chitinophagaceae bacterium]